MARVVRNELERELDLIFLINLARTMGDEFNGTKATAMLNEMRRNVARQQALALGHDVTVAEESADAAELSPQSVRRQLRQAREHAQLTARLGMAALLDGQIADLQAELDDSYATSDMIREDIERSRRVTQRMTKGRFRAPEDQQAHTAAGNEALALLHESGLAGTVQGNRIAELVGQTMSAPPVEPVDMVTVVKENAAAAALYSRLTAERQERRKLRQEMRELFYGREIVGNTHAGRETLTERLTGIDDPEQAQELAVRALTEELNVLVASEEIGVGPWTPEMIKVQRARTSDMLSRIRAVRELQGMTINSYGDAASFVFQVVELNPEGDEQLATIFPETK